MIVRSADFAMLAATLALSILCTATKRWVICSTVTSSDTTSCIDGSVWYRLIKVLTTVERGREQQRLVTDSTFRRIHSTCGRKPIGHTVGFVDHHVVDGGHRDSVALDQIDQRPGGPTRSTPARASRSVLSARRHKWRNRCGRPPRRRAPVRRTPDWRAHGSARTSRWLLRLGLRHQLRHGQAKGKGLARTGLGLAADISAGECVGDGEGLDGEGAVIPARTGRR